jgi:dephospho-CoA kinase
MRLRLGLTGGIGSGKSEVGKIFAALGALLIDADQLARDAVAPNSEALRRIAARWPQVLAADGSLDRAALADVIFADPGARDQVNAIVHPIVRARAAELEAAAGPDRIVVHEVPLLFEAGFYKQCDANVLVVADADTRVARVMQRSGLSKDEILRRMAAQIDPAEACRLATYTIENDGTLAELRAATERVWEALRSFTTPNTP